MRICQVTEISFSRLNGHAVVVDQLARQYLRMGHETAVVAQERGEKIVEAFAQLPYRVCRFSRSRFAWLERMRLRRQLTQLHQQWPFDVVHCHSSYPAGFAALKICSELRVPLVISSQGSDMAGQSRYRRHPDIMAKIRQTLARANGVIAISPFIKEQQLALAPSCATRLHEIPNGVDYDSCAAPIETSPNLPGREKFQSNPFILFLGRLHSRKGVSFLISAFEKIAGKLPDAQLVIAGDGPEAGALKTQAAQTALNERIHFVGMVLGTEKMWLLQHAVCVAVPTVSWEGLPLVALEAMACGQWMIATEVGGIIGLVQSGVDGFLVPPSDAAALADALLVPFQNPAQRAKITLAAKEKARRHDWKVVAEKHVSLFQQVITQKASPTHSPDTR